MNLFNSLSSSCLFICFLHWPLHSLLSPPVESLYMGAVYWSASGGCICSYRFTQRVSRSEDRLLGSLNSSRITVESVSFINTSAKPPADVCCSFPAARQLKYFFSTCVIADFMWKQEIHVESLMKQSCLLSSLFNITSSVNKILACWHWAACVSPPGPAGVSDLM